jgi:hypothetical protein
MPGDLSPSQGYLQTRTATLILITLTITLNFIYEAPNTF